MASNYTPNYNLCQWEADDKVLRTEFNEDNRKIDTALAGKASASALSSLQTTVNGLKTSKADVSALDSLKTTVTQHTSALSGKGNCQIYATSYTGIVSGKEITPKTFTFPKKPVLVMVYGAERRLTLIAGQPYGWSESRSSNSGLSVSWSGNSVTISGGYPTDHMNVSGQTYQLLALLQA